jgi:regulator of cell morphogenesis and NO signaling
LDAAASEKGVELEKLIADLNDVINAPPAEDRPVRDWTTASLTEFVDYIEERHHTFMKAQLPRLRSLLSAVQRAHAARHEEMLQELGGIYDSLQFEIEQHLMKEERILFPYIRQIDAFAQGRGEEPVVHCGTIQNPIRQMEHEHENAGEALAKMRDLTSNYRLPDDACNSFRALFDGLQALEADLHEHIHLENNILFPRAIEMECAGGKV